MNQIAIRLSSKMFFLKSLFLSDVQTMCKHLLMGMKKYHVNIPDINYSAENSRKTRLKMKIDFAAEKPDIPLRSW